VTTIVVKGGYMASDSAITDENNRNIGSIEKIFRLEHGHLYGSCGDGDDRELRRLLHGIQSPADMPTASALKKVDGDIEAIVLFKSGELWDVCTGKHANAFPVEDSHFAIGSGRQIATGVLDALDRVPSDWTMEKKVKTAVLVAIDRDIFSCGPVRVHKI
jgi:hypothetical protein